VPVISKQQEEDNDGLLEQLAIPLSTLCSIIANHMENYQKLCDEYERAYDPTVEGKARVRTPLLDEVEMNLKNEVTQRSVRDREGGNKTVSQSSFPLHTLLNPQTVTLIFHPFILQHLIMLLPHLDYSDEAGRRSTITLLRRLLTYYIPQKDGKEIGVRGVGSPFTFTLISPIIRALTQAVDGNVDECASIINSVAVEIVPTLSSDVANPSTTSSCLPYLRLLRILSSFLTLHRRRISPPLLSSILQRYVLPSITSPFLPLRALSVHLLSQCMLISNSILRGLV
jgi:hypothetical protein